MLYKDYVKCRRDYQEKGALFLINKKHCCLYYKPGKGKTYPAVDAMKVIDYHMKGEARVLILSSADAIKNMWKAEIEPQNILPKHTTMMSLSMGIQDARKKELLKQHWDIVVVDECHKIKSHNAKASKLVYALSNKTPYVWGLSGTPRGNNDIDIYCQFHNMCVGNWGEINYTTFINNCCDIEKKFFGDRTVVLPTGITESFRNAWDKQVNEFTQRIGYDDDELIEPIINPVLFDYKETPEYKEAMTGILQIKDYETTMTKLSAIQKLHQIVNGFVYLEDNNENRIVHNIEHNKKLDWLHENLKHKSTIVYRFEEDKNKIEEQLKKDNRTFTDVVEDFKNDKADILLLQCSRCESFNLQCCKNMIFYTLDYSYIKYNQMFHRIWRTGQTEQVEIDVLLFNNSIEMKIWNAVQNKEKLADLFMLIKKGV